MLVSRLPDGAVRTDAEMLRQRAIDSWALALLRRVRGDELPVPAAVVLPASTEEVATVLTWASQTFTAVIPRGGGSGVCGGAQAPAGAVVLDLSRMNRITDVDLVSQVAHVEAGVRGNQLEEALAEHGLTVGLYPQSIAVSTVGGWIAASSAGQASTGFGAIEDVLLGLPGLAARKQAAAEALHQAGVSSELGARYGEHWWQHRNDAVQTYAQIMGPERAFGSGVIVDTFEVAGLWSAVPRLYHGIREALAAHAQAVGCHLSHLYPSGSSLYFTFLISGADDRDAEARYLAAWDQAVRSCAAVGGTITHHHGVGRLKAGYLPAELGETGVEVLARIKAALDPAGVMNPRVLLP